MDIETAKTMTGKSVMSLDAGEKMVPFVGTHHGPYRLIAITKSGMAILEGRESERIPPSLLSDGNEN